MSVITDNYIWFIISGGVLLMITIGYYADKTGFGKKKIKDAVENMNEDNNEENSIDISNIPNVPINSIGNSHLVEEPLIIDEKMMNEVLEQNNLTQIVDTNSSNTISSANVATSVSTTESIFNNNGNLINSDISNSIVNPNDEDIWKF